MVSSHCWDCCTARGALPSQVVSGPSCHSQRPGQLEGFCSASRYHFLLPHQPERGVKGWWRRGHTRGITACLEQQPQSEEWIRSRHRNDSNLTPSIARRQASFLIVSALSRERWDGAGRAGACSSRCVRWVAQAPHLREPGAAGGGPDLEGPICSPGPGRPSLDLGGLLRPDPGSGSFPLLSKNFSPGGIASHGAGSKATGLTTDWKVLNLLEFSVLQKQWFSIMCLRQTACSEAAMGCLGPPPQDHTEGLEQESPGCSRHLDTDSSRFILSHLRASLRSRKAGAVILSFFIEDARILCPLPSLL
ncbi:uncharacterized protein [Equus przewalskii]|uniref:Uncharacterized protein n=1 Tax=Equus przewalskii TaxID=9798 RepID=A0ABM4M311_EQUPR